MVVDSWELDEANLDVPLFAWDTVSACKGHEVSTAKLVDVSWFIGLEQEKVTVALSSGRWSPRSEV